MISFCEKGCLPDNLEYMGACKDCRKAWSSRKKRVLRWRVVFSVEERDSWRKSIGRRSKRSLETWNARRTSHVQRRDSRTSAKPTISGWADISNVLKHLPGGVGLFYDSRMDIFVIVRCESIWPRRWRNRWAARVKKKYALDPDIAATEPRLIRASESSFFDNNYRHEKLHGG